MNMKLFGFNITIDRAEDKEHFARVIRRNYNKNVLGKIEAVKEVRLLFADTRDQRGTLRGALDYVDGRI